MTRPGLGGSLRHGPALLAYAAVTVLLTWPLVRVLGEAVPSDLGDPLMSISILWWNAQSMPFTDEWWRGNFFFPGLDNLTLSDHRVGLGLFATPIMWMGGSPLHAYAIMFLLTFFLSAAAAYALGWTLTSSRGAAFVAGCVYGFNPFRAAHLSHLELLASYCLPIILVALHQWFHTRHSKWLLVLSASLLLQALTSGYYFFFMTVFIAMFLVWFMRVNQVRRDAAFLGLALGAPLVAIAPVLVRYQRAHEAMGLSRSINEIQQYSADVMGMITAPPLLALWNFPPIGHWPEGDLMPGSVAVAVVGIAALLALRRNITPSVSPMRNRHLLLVGVVLAVAVALVPLVVGPVAFKVAGVSVSISSQSKPLSMAFACAVVWLATSPRVIAAFAARSAFAFYCLAALVMWLFAFGPEVRLLGHPVLYKAPYSWLMMLPGFSDQFRVPARFAMLAVLALSAAAALAVSRLAPRWPERLRLAGAVAIATAILAESWIYPFPLMAAPPRLEVPIAVPASAVVLELPIGLYQDAVAMFHATAHHRATVNGFSGYSPPHYTILARAVEEGRMTVLSVLRRRADVAVFIRRDSPRATQLLSHVHALADAVTLPSTATHNVILLARQPEHVSSPSRAAEEIEVTTTAASQVGASALRLLVDGDYRTAWKLGLQQGGERIYLSLQEPRSVSGVRLALGAEIRSFPREIAIDVSLDGHRWTPVHTADGAVAALEAALQDPRHIDMEFAFEPRLANHIRVRQTGQSVDEWAVAELRVLAQPAE